MILPHLSDKERCILRLVLLGESIIELPRFFLSTPDEVRQFLKLNEYNLEDVRDQDRLMAVHNEAVGYLKNQLGMDLPADLTQPDKIQDVFLIASNTSDPVLRSGACSLLKTMNVINHIDGRELLYNCPISSRDLFNLVEDKVERALSTIVLREVSGTQYQGGRKQKDSLITKLLAKRETIAAQINDRVRYRIITPSPHDIPKVLLRLFETVLPVNYVIPNASANDLISPHQLLGPREALSLAARRRLSQLRGIFERLFPYPPPEREFTGKGYRIIKFAVDIPVRLHRFLGATSPTVRTEALGSIAYVLVEFQIVDQEMERNNNTGENEHRLYKERQKRGVTRRLVGHR